MRILFIYIDTHSSGGFSTGLGISFLSGYLKKYNHKTDLVYFKSKTDLDYTINKIQRFLPNIIGFYSTSVSVSTVKTLSQRIRQEYPHCYQIYGGIHATLVPETIYEIKTLDALCVGYGEIPLLRYGESIESNSGRHDIPGLWLRPSLQNNADIIKNPAYVPDTDPDEFFNFDCNIFPDELQRFPNFNRNEQRLEIIFNRGCPFKCSFCSNKNLMKIYGNKLFIPSPEKSIAFVKNAVEETKYKAVNIHDDIFTVFKPWFRTFITLYAEEIGLPILCNLRAGCFDEEDVRLLKSANVQKVWIGLESGNDFIRNEVMNKGISRKQLKESISLLHKYGIGAITQNMIGVPYETPKKFIDTILLNAELNPSGTELSIFYPYPKTELYELCQREHFIMEPKEGLIEREDTILNMSSFPAKKIHFYFRNFDRLLQYQKMRNKNRLQYLLPLKPWLSHIILNYMIWFGRTKRIVKILLQRLNLYNL